MTFEWNENKMRDVNYFNRTIVKLIYMPTFVMQFKCAYLLCLNIIIVTQGNVGLFFFKLVSLHL